MESVRIDKWLWAARFFKTRSTATDAVLGGHVHVGGARVKPSREVRVGETVDVVTNGHVRRTVVVTALAERRGPAAAAAALYEETPESLAAREQQALERRLTAPIFGARPTKLERRRLDALRKAQRRR
ncbi:MAG TPA: S4 domain-containing protein [Gaiellaceae bacterium]